MQNEQNHSLKQGGLSRIGGDGLNGAVGETGDQGLTNLDLGAGANNRAIFFSGGDGIAAAKDFLGSDGAEVSRQGVQLRLAPAAVVAQGFIE